MTDQTVTPQVARWARREQLLVLLSRMQRGVLLPAERDLLRAAVETELTDADAAHAALERVERMADVLATPPYLEPGTDAEMIRAAITGVLPAPATKEPDRG